ncbi:MAG: hydroxylase [Amycolatopsis sp.]|uniref:NmrA family NAD(P)-binding protein n=1 Tax=Amycolatopsis sp. TaxID=37632 RepID=UPI002621DB33|nr:NAD(P)H-binding protein [Amycolatopsis sp.]MCU1679784.1 hydroxylase [Amycolatopsis sp.]
MTSAVRPVLVTGAAGTTGGVGGLVVANLLSRGLPVRALVRRSDERADALRAQGAEVVVADLTRAGDIAGALDGCRGMYFGMSVSAQYVEATAAAAAAALDHGQLEIFVNMSQMTVSQMSLNSSAESNQQRLHWLGEQILNWSGLPVAHVRPTTFLENPLFKMLAADSIRREDTIRLPFGSARTSPVAASDVAEVVSTLLAHPANSAGRVYELTGSTSRDLAAIAAEFSAALGRKITYVDMSYEDWLRELGGLGLPEHVFDHISTMARLHADNRYDRASGDIEAILGRPASGIADFVGSNPALFAQSMSG